MRFTYVREGEGEGGGGGVHHMAGRWDIKKAKGGGGGKMSDEGFYQELPICF